MTDNRKKRVLITGETGYIARQLRLYLVCEGYSAQNISIRKRLPEPDELEPYGVVVHCAALVHERRRAKKDYYKINTELTRRLAINFKRGGGGQFVFLSTMAVYGAEASLGGRTIIDEATPKNPKGYYGRSKLIAEQSLLKMEDEAMRISIIRPPIVYGADCPGNYAHLVKASKILKIFPYIRNERSMIHIDSLCKYIAQVIRDELSGVFHPQDQKYHCTSDIVKSLAKENGNNMYLSKTLGGLVKALDIPQTRKIFGSLIYSKTLR